jgi:chromate transporter
MQTEPFNQTSMQRIVRRGLAALVVGFVIDSGHVMARSGDTGWPAAAITAAAVPLMFATRFNPLWIPAAGGVAGGPGLL